MRFAERLASLGFDTYEAYLRSDHWKAFKASYRSSGRSILCAVCNGKPIQLHHHSYERLGHELLTDITPLCREHHEAVHIWLKTRKASVRKTGQAITCLRNEKTAKSGSKKAAKIDKLQSLLQEARSLAKSKKQKQVIDSIARQSIKKSIPRLHSYIDVLRINNSPSYTLKNAKQETKRHKKKSESISSREREKKKQEDLLAFHGSNPMASIVASVGNGCFMQQFAQTHYRPTNKKERKAFKKKK